MAKRPKTKTPIMAPDDERFLAFYSLVQWTQAVVTQSARVSAARDHLLSSLSLGPSSTLKQCLEAAQQRIQASQAWHRVPFLRHRRTKTPRLSRLDPDLWAMRFG
jgi:hypothetical protein